MNSRKLERLGAFPLRGPLTYLHLTLTEVREALRGPYPANSTWFHQTDEAEAGSAAWQGLIPSCWVGGDGCCVFGDDRRQPASPYRGDWLLQIQSPALPEQQRAWWVPPAQIVGAWHDGVFYSATELRELGPPLLCPTGTCGCDLAELVGKQVALWRMSLAADA